MQFPIGIPLKPRLYLQPFSRYSVPSHVRAHNRHTDTCCNLQVIYILSHAVYCVRQTKQKSEQKLAHKSTLRTQITVVPMKLQASQTTPLGYANACIGRQTTRLRWTRI